MILKGVNVMKRVSKSQHEQNEVMAKFEGRVIHGRLKFANSVPRWWCPQGLEKEIFGMVWNFSLLAQVTLCPGIPTLFLHCHLHNPLCLTACNWEPF